MTQVRTRHTFVDDHGGWSYTTVYGDALTAAGHRSQRRVGRPRVGAGRRGSTRCRCIPASGTRGHAVRLGAARRASSTWPTSWGRDPTGGGRTGVGAAERWGAELAPAAHDDRPRSATRSVSSRRCTSSSRGRRARRLCPTPCTSSVHRGPATTRSSTTVGDARRGGHRRRRRDERPGAAPAGRATPGRTSGRRRTWLADRPARLTRRRRRPARMDARAVSARRRARPRRTSGPRESCRSRDGSPANGSRSSSARSAYLPTSSVPVTSSRWFTHAEPCVYAVSADSRLIACSGRKGSLPEWSSPSGGGIRVTATCAPHMHVGAAHRPVAAADQPRAGPLERRRTGTATASAARRGTESSARPSAARDTPTTAACSHRRRERRTAGRRRDGSPGCARGGGAGRSCRWLARAASMPSSASRTARSPIAWKCTWKPSASSATTASRRTAGSTNESPAFCVWQPQASRYGEVMAPVKFSATPSCMILMLVARNRVPAPASRRAT